MDYQQKRKPGTPHAKFIVAMQPAPVCLGSLDDALALLRSPPRGSYTFTPADFQRGGRQVGDTVVEFYTKDDPTSIRIDVWVNRQIDDADTGEPIYQGILQVKGNKVNLWS